MASAIGNDVGREQFLLVTLKAMRRYMTR